METEPTFWMKFWTPESILWCVIGLVLGVFLSVWINIKWSYVIRKWLKIAPTITTYYYEYKTEEFVKDSYSSDNPMLCFVVLRNEATSTLTFNFIDHFHRPTKTHIRLDKKFDFPFYRIGRKRKFTWKVWEWKWKIKTPPDFIKEYDEGKLDYFLDSIFWNPTNNWYKPDEVNFTNNEESVRKVFPEIPKYPS